MVYTHPPDFRASMAIRLEVPLDFQTAAAAIVALAAEATRGLFCPGTGFRAEEGRVAFTSRPSGNALGAGSGAAAYTGGAGGSGFLRRDAAGVGIADWLQAFLLGERTVGCTGALALARAAPLAPAPAVPSGFLELSVVPQGLAASK